MVTCMSLGGAQFADFRPVAEVTSDDRVRVALTKAGAHPSDRFLMSASAAGDILLTPLASIPKRELLAWENEALRASLQSGIAQAAAGVAEPAPGLIETLEQA